MFRLPQVFFAIGALTLVALVLVVFLASAPPVPSPAAPGEPNAQPAATVVALSPSTTAATGASSTLPAQKAALPATSSKKQLAASTPAPATQATSSNEAFRVQHPYDSPPESFGAVNAAARAALVNILCMPRQNGSIKPISGSGVLIDPRGVILTNAHVAQYVLLSEDPQVDLACTVRTGAPAKAQYSMQVLYLPPIWVQGHASEITTLHPTGTGEHDYALLLVTHSLDGSPLPAAFPYLPFDTREAIAFKGDTVLVASYPAEFLGGLAAEYDLYPASSLTTIGQLVTFKTNTVDILTLGGIIEAQSGSSGGAVVNAWGKLVGLVVTTTEGTTTAERDLHALTLSYIDRDLLAQAGQGLTAMFGGNVGTEAAVFTRNQAPSLINLFIPYLNK